MIVKQINCRRNWASTFPQLFNYFPPNSTATWA